VGLTTLPRSVVKELQARFKHYQDTGDLSKIPADLGRITYITAVEFGGKAEYETVKKLWKNAPNPSVKRAAMVAMGATRQPELWQDLLDLVLKDAQKQDIPTFFAGMASHKIRREIGTYLKENYDKLTELLGGVPFGYCLKYSFSNLCTQQDAADTKAFFDAKDNAKYNLALAQTLDAIDANAKWLEACRDEVVEWLALWKAKSRSS